jgi:hypothetical protein
MPKNKDRKNMPANDQDRGRREQRAWSPNHKTGRGGGNRK